MLCVHHVCSFHFAFRVVVVVALFIIVVVVIGGGSSSISSVSVVASTGCESILLFCFLLLFFIDVIFDWLLHRVDI